jgi:hypothetical protein
MAPVAFALIARGVPRKTGVGAGSMDRKVSRAGRRAKGSRMEARERLRKGGSRARTTVKAKRRERKSLICSVARLKVTTCLG